MRTLLLSIVPTMMILAACTRAETNRPTESASDASTPSTVGTPDTTNGSVDARRRIVVLGNSLAAGYGLQPEQSFPALLQARIDSLGWQFRVQNAGISGETTAGGLRRLGALLADPVHVLILELGANDGLRGLPAESTRDNLQAMIDQARGRYPDLQIILYGMMLPPNFGRDYTEAFRAIYPDLARKNDVKLVPFLLQGVGGVDRLNQQDGIHPTAEGQRILADNVWAILKPTLQQMGAES